MRPHLEDELARRLLPLEGGINFRDMGGYATTHGRRVKWRHLYRSGTLARLTPADFDHLDDLGIRSVVDFRTKTEQTHEPSHWALRDNVIYWARDHEETFGNLHDMVDRGIASVEDAHAIMIGGYRHLPLQQAEAYGQLFRLLAGGELPLAFHCTAGKDRTGGAAALILSVLGVPRETIAADFNMTERAVDFKKAFQARAGDPNAARYAGLDPVVMAPIGSAHPEFVAAFLDSVEQECGSVENYLKDLGLSKSDLEAVRESLLD